MNLAESTNAWRAINNINIFHENIPNISNYCSGATGLQAKFSPVMLNNPLAEK